MTTLEEAFLGVESSLTGRRWRERPIDERLGEALCEQFGLPDILGRVLSGRGVDLKTAESFLRPTLKTGLPDPFCLKDMDAAVNRIIQALQAGETITIFGDYDVDGATSSALLSRFLSACGATINTYIPDRLNEGYGPNERAIRALRDQGSTLIITVDCGTLSFAPLKVAADIGLDAIVVDHHKAEPALPEAIAVINPNRLDETDGCEQLAAVGVAFLLAVAINRRLREAGWFSAERTEPDLFLLLDLVAVGTVCDVVPLTGPNRALVAQGLKVLARRRNTGLAALSDIAGLEDTPGVYHLGFLLGPRINAGGRVGESDLGVRLLTTEDEAEAREISSKLDRYNIERRQLEAEILEQATARLTQEIGIKGTEFSVSVVAGEGWHPGVIGIVASRLKDKFGIPAFVISINGTEATGSARSIAGVDVGSAIIEAVHQGILIKGGGHAMAAGFSLLGSDIEAFTDFLNERLGGAVRAARSGRVLDLDGSISVGGATPELVESLTAAGPFGVGNPSPRFALRDVEVVHADIVGADHVRCFFTGRDGGRLKGIAFRAAEEALGDALLTGVGRRFHIAGRLKIDDWAAAPRVELHIEDAAFARAIGHAG